MRATWWFRAAGILLLLFAALHTFGFLSFRPASAEGLAVWQAMDQVHFRQGSATFSYGQFYRGFGLFITAFYLFTSWLAWSLGAMARRSAGEAARLAWGLIVLQCVGVGLSVALISAKPATLSGVVVVCLVMGLVSLRRQTSARVA